MQVISNSKGLQMRMRTPVRCISHSSGKHSDRGSRDTTRFHSLRQKMPRIPHRSPQAERLNVQEMNMRNATETGIG